VVVWFGVELSATLAYGSASIDCSVWSPICVISAARCAAVIEEPEAVSVSKYPSSPTTSTSIATRTSIAVKPSCRCTFPARRRA